MAATNPNALTPFGRMHLQAGSAAARWCGVGAKPRGRDGQHASRRAAGPALYGTQKAAWAKQPTIPHPPGPGRQETIPFGPRSTGVPTPPL